MIVRLACGALQGVDAFRVDLEVDFLRKGMPAFVMVGLAEGAVREAKERVFAAMRSCGFTLPAARITVNLAPADRRKAGSAYDLPLAVALLGAAGVLPAERVETFSALFRKWKDAISEKHWIFLPDGTDYRIRTTYLWHILRQKKCLP